MKKKYKRLLIASGAFFLLSFIVFFFLAILKENISFFYSVSEAMVLPTNNQKTVRIGGTIVENSIIRYENEVTFKVTDFNKDILVKFQGVLPPMFSEKNGVVIQGKILDKNTFLADTVLAKHDENYMARKQIQEKK